MCFIRILQVPAAYSPIDPDAPPTISTYFMKKSNLQYILVENDKINVNVHASTGSIKEQFKRVDMQIEFCFNKLGWSAFVFSWQKVVFLIQKRTSLKSEVQNASSLFKKKCILSCYTVVQAALLGTDIGRLFQTCFFICQG